MTFTPAFGRTNNGGKRPMWPCSHVWKDQRFIRQLVHNRQIAPWQMEKGRVYECVNCTFEVRP